MAMMEISVVPVGTKSPSVSVYVAEMIKRLGELGVEFQLTPMGTVLVGDLDHLLRVAGLLHRVPLEMGAARVVTTLKIDERTDKPLTLEGKIRSVQEKLG